MKSQLKVSLINFTPQPEKTIAAAAKLCYSRVGVEEIDENLTPENVERFLKILMDMGHESPIEHVSFTFGVEGVSRAMSHQLVRHRVGCSYSQQSQRYVKLEQFDYIIPPSIEAIPEARERFIQAMAQAQGEYNFLVELLLDRHTKTLKEDGLGEVQAGKAAEKMAIEDARYIFPNACETKVVFTMNARALYHFFHQRCCQRAQWEIRQLATEMLKTVREISPVLFAKAGPPCLKGACPEKQMTCGSAEEVRAKFQNL